MFDVNQAFEAEIPCLQRYARKLTRDEMQAEELVQESLVRGLDKIHLWQEGTNLRAWLCTILHNQYVNQLRRLVQEGIAVELSEVEESLSRPPTQDINLQLRDVTRVLNDMSAGQRDAVLMIGLDGLGYERAATLTGVPVGTVRSRLSRGRQRLRMAA
jgi:RNA polymerase sigma-70 factor, ECF subfamily